MWSILNSIIFIIIPQKNNSQAFLYLEVNEMKFMKIARVKKNLRQIDISNKTGIPASLLSLYENGLKMPSSVHAKKINEVLNEKVFDTQESMDQLK